MNEELKRMVRMTQADPSQENLVKLGLAYLRSISRNLPPFESINVFAKRWRDTFGNSHYNVRVFIDGRDLGSRRFDDYGIARIAAQIIRDEAGVDVPDQLGLWAHQHGIRYLEEVQQVPRRRDLEF